MTLLEFQHRIVDALNDDATLMQGGCKAFAEDALDVDNETQRHLQEAGGVAIVVMTPRMKRGGTPPNGGLHCVCEGLTVMAYEVPAVNRLRPGAMTALDAAMRASLVLEGCGIPWSATVQEDIGGGALAARATFDTDFTFNAQ